MYKITLKVDGMRCGMCESHVNDIVRKTIELVSVKSSHVKGQTVVVVKNEINADVLSKAISEVGYEVSKVTIEKYESKSLFGFLKKKKTEEDKDE